MEHFGLHVDNCAVAHGGTQTIKTHNDYTLPLDFVNGLPDLPMRPFTNLEWDSLPHICLTSDVESSPDVLDHVIMRAFDRSTQVVSIHGIGPQARKSYRFMASELIRT